MLDSCIWAGTEMESMKSTVLCGRREGLSRQSLLAIALLMSCIELMVSSWAVKLNSASSISSLLGFHTDGWRTHCSWVCAWQMSCIPDRHIAKFCLYIFSFVFASIPPSWAHHISLILDFYFTEVTSSEYQSRQFKWATDMKIHQLLNASSIISNETLQLLHILKNWFYLF